MTREEFLKIVNEKNKENGIVINCITDDEWRVIETVYSFHPSIDEIRGKIQIAELYVQFGFPVIKDMEIRANAMAIKERKCAEIKAALKYLEEEMEALRKGYWIPED